MDKLKYSKTVATDTHTHTLCLIYKPAAGFIKSNLDDCQVCEHVSLVKHKKEEKKERKDDE